MINEDITILKKNFKVKILDFKTIVNNFKRSFGYENDVFYLELVCFGVIVGYVTNICSRLEINSSYKDQQTT